MSKKVKKIFKKRPLIAPKVTLNRKWTVWRQAESKKNYLYSQFFLNSLITKSFIQDSTVSQDVLDTSINYLNSMPKKSSVSSLKNYCYYVGKSRSFNRELFISRHTTRRLARFGLLSGLTKERC